MYQPVLPAGSKKVYINKYCACKDILFYLFYYHKGGGITLIISPRLVRTSRAKCVFCSLRLASFLICGQRWLSRQSGAFSWQRVPGLIPGVTCRGVLEQDAGPANDEYTTYLAVIMETAAAVWMGMGSYEKDFQSWNRNRKGLYKKFVKFVAKGSNKPHVLLKIVSNALHAIFIDMYFFLDY